MGLEKRYGFVYVNRNDDRIDAAAKKKSFYWNQNVSLANGEYLDG